MWKKEFYAHRADCITVGVLFCFYWFYGETATPFKRQFQINDLTISHPFATAERVTDNQLYVISCIIPSLIIVFLSGKKLQAPLALLGLWLVVTITGLVTDILKLWIGNPRPDFLARCDPVKGTAVDRLVDVSVCTAPLGDYYLIDGMKSTPSGHSSVAFSGLGYLTIWIFHRYQVLHTYQRVIACCPLLIAVYIALSRTQDYRHHFFDVIFGSVLGTLFTGLIHRNYLKAEERPSLPV